MCSLSACSGFLIVSFVAVRSTLSIQTMVESSLINLFADHTFVDDDLCSSIINDHPCVKNILAVLVNHISDNIRETKLNKERNSETIDILANQLRKNQEVLDSNQHEIKLLKEELKQLKINTNMKKNFKVRDENLNRKPHLLHTTRQNKEKFRWLKEDENRQIIGNSSQVSYFASYFFMTIRHIIV